MTIGSSRSLFAELLVHDFWILMFVVGFIRLARTLCVIRLLVLRCHRVAVVCIAGCAGETETFLRQSLTERLRSCLSVNTVGRCILKLEM